MAEEKNNWHNLSLPEIFQILKTKETGLTDQEAFLRLKKFGPNVLGEKERFVWLKIFWRQVKNPIVYLLFLTGCIALLIKETLDAGIIFAAVFLNILVGFLQETKASRVLHLLKKSIVREAKVIRNGQISLISVENLVPGDIVFLETGDQVPADGRLIEAYNLEISEAVLTGESTPVQKSVETLPEETPLPERKNFVFSGTVVTSGKGKFVVTKTGKQTVFGQIIKLSQTFKEEITPLGKRVQKLANFLAKIILLIIFLFFLYGFFIGKNIYEIFLTSITLAVASLPESLPFVITIVLAIGAEKLLKEKVVVKNLMAAETLGSISALCVDKTGTITEGKMEVTEVLSPLDFLLPQEVLKKESETRKNWLKKINQAMILGNDSKIKNPQSPVDQWEILGNATEKAIFLAGVKSLGLEVLDLKKKFLLYDEIPFDSIRKYAATAYQTFSGEKIVYFRGAPEILINQADFFEDFLGQRQEFSLEKKKVLLENVASLASQGFRLVALSYRQDQDEKKVSEQPALFQNSIFLGLILLSDPLRPGIKEMVEDVKKAGVRTIMITGDHPAIALKIGQEIGLGSQDKIMTGQELEKISDKEFKEKVKEIPIYARTTPLQKLKIVKALKANGEIVAMTGDGVNDAPALKNADVGIAVGSGTDIAKEVAPVVILENNFQIIIKAIKGGRTIFENIQKSVAYLVSDHLHELVVSFLSLLFGLPLPLLPVQILWLNLIEDSLPAVSLAFEPSEADVLKFPPRPRNETILNRPLKIFLFISALIFSLTTFLFYYWLNDLTSDLAYTRTMMFILLTGFSLFFVMLYRSLRKSVFRLNPFSNRFLIFSLIYGWGMLFLAVYLPSLQAILKIVPLKISDWILLLGVMLFQLGLIEFLKQKILFKAFNSQKKYD